MKAKTLRKIAKAANKLAVAPELHEEVPDMEKIYAQLEDCAKDGVFYSLFGAHEIGSNQWKELEKQGFKVWYKTACIHVSWEKK